MADDSLVGLLDQLGPYAEPPPVSMWPATPAWWVAGLVVLVALGVLLRLWLCHREATAYRREALADLKPLAEGLRSNSAQALAGLDLILRRTALTAFARPEVAGLRGEAWIGFLDRTGGAFAAHAPAMLAAPYARAVPAFDGAAVLAAARHWIRHHA